MKKNPTPQDWHAADLVAAVKKSGTSFQRLSRLHGFGQGTLSQAVYRPYPKCEGIIASHLNTTPQAIWPSRYNLDGTPKSGRGERGIGRHPVNLKPDTTRSLHAKRKLKCSCNFIHQTEKTNNTQVNNPLPIKQLKAA